MTPISFLDAVKIFAAVLAAEFVWTVAYAAGRAGIDAFKARRKTEK